MSPSSSVKLTANPESSAFAPPITAFSSLVNFSDKRFLKPSNPRAGSYRTRWTRPAGLLNLKAKELSFWSCSGGGEPETLIIISSCTAVMLAESLGTRDSEVTLFGAGASPGRSRICGGELGVSGRWEWKAEFPSAE